MAGEERVQVQVLKNRNNECSQETRGSLQRGVQGAQRTWRHRGGPAEPSGQMPGSRSQEYQEGRRCPQAPEDPLPGVQRARQIGVGWERVGREDAE